MINVKFTVSTLREIASTMNITIPSKARKDEIIALINEGIESAHSEAIDLTGKIAAIDSVITPVSLVKDVTGPKSYTQRMIGRTLGYARQNGHAHLTEHIGDAIARFTPRQRSRYLKKVRAAGK
jgi:hypothetical protein